MRTKWLSSMPLHHQAPVLAENFEQPPHDLRSIVLVDAPTIASRLRQCRTTTHGRLIHHLVISQGFVGNIFLENLILQMYGNCAAMDDAHAIFENLQWRDQFSWNFMAISCSRHGEAEEALHLFDQMQHEGVVPDEYIFASIAGACALKDAGACPLKDCLMQGEKIHACVVYRELGYDVAIGTALVNMYSKCGKLSDGQKAFDQIAEQNVFSWTTIISAFAQQGHGKEARQLFHGMMEEAVLPNKITFLGFLPAFDSKVMLTNGKYMHACIIGAGFQLDVMILNAIVGMYGKCSSMEHAQVMFDGLPVRDVVLWNTLIVGYIQHDKQKEAFNCFGAMQQQGVAPNTVTFLCVISSFTSEADCVHSKQTHSLIVCHGFDNDISLGNALVTMYGRCGPYRDAQAMFDRMVTHDIISWNSIIAACTWHCELADALHLLARMQLQEIKRNNVTFISLLSACSYNAALDVGKILHSDIIECGVDADILVTNVLVDFYGQCGSLDCAMKLFDKRPKREVASWIAIIAAHGLCGQTHKAFQLFEEMQLEGVFPNQVAFTSMISLCADEDKFLEGKQLHLDVLKAGLNTDVAIGTCLVNMYGKCGSLEDAHKIFDNLQDRNSVSWNALISAHVYHGNGGDALQLFHQMQQEGVVPDSHTFMSTLAACACERALIEGKSTHARIWIEGAKFTIALQNALLNMYAKAGSLEDAQRLFCWMPKHDIISWTCMIDACTQHGHGELALQVFDQMKKTGLQPDELTFICVLSACSRAGLVQEGLHFFASMIGSYGIEPRGEHFNCMLDLLGKSASLDDVEALLSSMPFSPSTVSWMTLLSACRTRVDVEKGENAANHLFELEPLSPKPYLVLSNIYTEVSKQMKVNKFKI